MYEHLCLLLRRKTPLGKNNAPKNTVYQKKQPTMARLSRKFPTFAAQSAHNLSTIPA